MHSALYDGRVSHRRRGPTGNAFRYRMFMVWLDLAELPDVFQGRWLWSTSRPALARFRRADYLGPQDRPLDVAVRDLVAARTGRRPAGAIRMLTHLRYFGCCFNPVTFYYCFDSADHLETLVAEITNTPWGERFQYVLPVAEAAVERGQHVWRFGKRFHVSPFLPMEMDYEWRCTAPDQALGVHMRNSEDGRELFDVTLALRRRPLTPTNLATALLRFPLLTARIVAMIHWQALKLWLKGTPFYVHPASAAGAPDH
ncbi:MAG TPA: DUF1365 domain-containing protein [Candidatus Acidoferrales bacterium]|nr:DUF1365 domain-containing protein [Candidatus Acidoferrales bacterium]